MREFALFYTVRLLHISYESYESIYSTVTVCIHNYIKLSFTVHNGGNH